MHFQKISFILILLTVLSAVSAKNNTCAPTTPFSSSLIGKTFSKLDDCYRPRSWNELFVYRRMSILKVSEGVPFICAEQNLLIYRKPQLSPMIIKYPKLIYNTSVVSKAGVSDTNEDINKYCKKEQQKKKIEMFPVNKTRGLFINTVKEILPLLYEIRDFGCTGREGFFLPVKGRAYDNTDVQAIITYIHTIAFQYQFCI